MVRVRVSVRVRVVRARVVRVVLGFVLGLRLLGPGLC